MAANSDEIPPQIGRYEIVKRIGEGATSKVLLGRDSFNGNEVAIKIFNEPPPPMEWQNLRSLDHPAIPKMVDSILEWEGHKCLVTEYVEGTPLSILIAEKKTFTPDRALSLVAEIADVLQYVHQRKVMHLDIKPANLLIRPDESFAIIDFGSSVDVATLMGDPERSFGGSPLYASPELCRGTIDMFSARPDIFSLGAVLYELLAQIVPYSDSKAAAAARALETESTDKRWDAQAQKFEGKTGPTDITTFDESIPESVREICDRALKVDANERFSTMAQLAKALRGVQAPQQVSPTPVQPSVLPALRSIRFRRGQFIGVGIGVLALILGVLWVGPSTIQSNGKTSAGNPGPVIADDPLAHSPNDKTDLFAAIDWDRHSFQGNWHKVGNGVQCDPSEFARIIIPKVPQGNYTLTIRFTPRTHNPELNIQLPVGRYCLIAKVGGESPLAFIQGSETQSQALETVSALEAAKEYVLTARVMGDDSAATIGIELDGALVLDWKGDPELVGSRSDWSLPLPSLGIGAHNAIVTFLDASVQMDTGELAPLREFVPRTELPSGQWIQGLDYIDLSEHVVHGKWLAASETTQSDPGFWPAQGTAFARLAIPVDCSGSYEMRALWTWLGASETLFLIPVGNSGCGLWVSNERNELGIENVIDPGMIETRRIAKLPIRTSAEVFDYSLKIVVTIREEADSASIEATLETADSITPFKWSGKLTSLGQRHDWRLAQGCRLGVGSHQVGTVLFRSLQIRAESGGVWYLKSGTLPSMTTGALNGTNDSFTNWAIQRCEKNMKFYQQTMLRPKEELFYRNRLAELRSNR